MYNRTPLKMVFCLQLNLKMTFRKGDSFLLRYRYLITAYGEKDDNRNKLQISGKKKIGLFESGC